MDTIRYIFGNNVSMSIIITFFLLIIFLVLFALKKMQKITHLEKKNDDLENHLDAMDEQARLIVKTDLELSQTQEELDRKVTSLMALQELSRVLSGSLEEDKLFANINEDIIGNLGFEFCVFIIKEKNNLAAKCCLGYTDRGKLGQFLDWMNQNNYLDSLTAEGVVYHDTPSNLDSFKAYLEDTFGLKSFVAGPIQVEENTEGLVILGNYFAEGGIRISKEIIEILSSQVARAIENIRLFDKLYSSQKQLEVKVKERTQDLEEALDKVKKVSRLKTEFVSAVSHEFRTPLTSVKGYASLLVQDKFGKIPEQVKIRLGRINQQADMMVSMINELLDIARIESGRMSIDLRKIEMNELIKKIGDNLMPQMHDKDIELVLDLSPDTVVEADKQLTERVLMNLLSNAVKFTPDGKKITVSTSLDKGFLRVSVKDQGPGIEPEDRENIFKEFYRTESASGIKGTGLGLSLVNNIILAHKGDIWVESLSGEGANFIFILPKTRDN